MKDDDRRNAPENPTQTPALTRRRFFQVAGTFGFTTAVIASAGGFLHSDEAVAQTANEERERQQAAERTMTVATAYIITADRSYPIMQLDFKENLQNMSNGRIYVRLAPNGQLGTGSALAQSVQEGTIECAQHSLSNFAPFAPVVDLINIPYWCGDNQQFANLVTSAAWRNEVNPKVEERGFKPLWYVTIDPRTVAVGRGVEGPVRTPDDIQGIKFRVPGSQILQQFYRLLGANPTPVAWGETPSAIQQGVADALDPSVGALYVFGFKDILSSITLVRSVPDAQVYSCNKAWYDALDGELQEAIDFASETTFRQNLAKVPAARAYAMSELSKSGVDFYAPTEDELAQWSERAGHQRSEWDSVKTELAGSIEAFERLREAAETDGGYYVHDA
ncbi:TRAP transporter substrate-binding protein [Salinarimonas sp.]|uniref:TRAP transporter substrate-binding protein n=1 Tax=Salinarimonas sp. TaxID=2766526 RepID=UPI0032D99763